MVEKKSLLFVAGLGSTGSSALCDVLSEYNGVLCPSQEWRIWVDPDGLVDLGKKLSGETSMFYITTGVNRFTKLVKQLTNPGFGPYSKLKLPSYVKDAYINIEQDIKKEFGCEGYKGLWYGNSQSILASANFVMKRKFWKKDLVNKQMWLTDFSTRDEALSIIGSAVEKQLFNHLEETGNKHFAINENFSILFADSILKMHKESKIVVVVRDLLDVYADSHRVGWLAMPYDIEQFIKWQKRMYHQLIELKSSNPERIHIVGFESLCNDYDCELERLKKFVPELMETRITERFKPEISKNNIGQWRNSHPWLEKYSDECQSIVNMLDVSE
ncbi:sulfotransferase [Vibrio sp. SCSIO 43136]|uniref:sulfotransferase n=1 Tax=Vibrio sp. SCSIO 43136 TaxID=2819101 RepID=UPI002075AF8A|nr:sulfotransferase [Vibrio sp. SCSIO 43136]USD65115.1 sulfotransferase [Vibrio sp. SCSIO 43136]